jgi:hypothetical protein
MSGTEWHDPYRSLSTKLESVSPSRYGALRAWKEGRICALQLLWKGKASLAPYPAAKLGDVVHRMLDQLPAGADEAEAKLAWDEALAHTESRLNADWVTRGLLPLPRTVRGYALKRILTIRSVLHSMPTRNYSGAAGGAPATFREENLQSEDGLLKGRADLIEQRDGEWVLVDYKSGSIHEDDEVSGGQRIKEEYALQLRLYAHLIREAKGMIISKALLRTLDGCEHEVRVDAIRVGEAGNEARALLGSFNAHISDNPKPESLALPMASSWSEGVFGCAGCLYRPSCSSYISSRKLVEPGKRWPKDVWGEVKAIKRENGRVLFEILNENNLRDPDDRIIDSVVVIEVKDSLERHPGTAGIEIGGKIRIFDYLEASSMGVRADGPRTCVYGVG